MGKSSTVLELNGKRYDASTGQLMTNQNHASSVAGPPAVKGRGRAIDGFIASPSPALQPQPKAHAPAIKPATAAARSAATMDVMVARPSRTSGNHLRAHRAEPTKTLMRSTVKRPGKPLKQRAKVQPHTGALVAAPEIEIVPKLSINNVDEERLERAQRAKQNQLISRFGYIAPVARQNPPIQRAAEASAAPAVATQPAAKARATDIFEQALANATGHLEKPVKPKKRLSLSRKKKSPGKTRRRAANFTAAVLACLMIGGFIAYQNKANLTMHVAAAKAGFDATMPGWHPAGYAAGGVEYKTGFVAVNFNNSHDHRSYTLTQKASNWDSNTLLNEYVAAKYNSYQTYQAAGRTVYIYGDSNAAWVSHGVQFEVKSHDSLTAQQLAQIAAST